MPKKRKKDVLVLETKREGALLEILDGVMILVNLLRNDKTIKKNSPELAKILDNIAENSEMIKKVVELAQPLMPDGIKILANLLKQAVKLLSNFKMDNSIIKNLGVLSSFFPHFKKLKGLSDEKVINELQKDVQGLVDDVRDNSQKLLLNSPPRDLPELKSFTDACLQFVVACKEKLLNIFKKVEKTIQAEEELELDTEKNKDIQTERAPEKRKSVRNQ